MAEPSLLTICNDKFGTASGVVMSVSNELGDKI